MFKYSRRIIRSPIRSVYQRMFAVDSSSTAYKLNDDPGYLKFYNESRIQLINELETSILDFETTHEGRSDVSGKFPEVLGKWGWKLLKSPFMNPKDDYIHLTKLAKSNETDISVDVLLDYRIPENEGVREMQLLLTRGNLGSLYFIGTLDKTVGFTSGSCIYLPDGTRKQIVDGDQSTFNSLGSKFTKYMENDETELDELNMIVRDLLKTNSLSELEGVREKFDILLYDYMGKETGLIGYGEAAFNSKLLNVIWLISVYSELEANKNWMIQLKDVLN